MRKLLFLLLACVLFVDVPAHASSTRPDQKSWVIVYREDEGNLRGKPQQAVVVASSSADARDSFHVSHPKATVISCSEKSPN